MDELDPAGEEAPRRERRNPPERRGRPRVEHVEIEQKTTDKPVRLVVRNNSRIQTMQSLLERFGSVATSGRYFVPEEQDASAVAEWCAENHLFVKKSDLGPVAVLDVMTDKDLRYK